jgi:hypothetical protein
MEIEEFLANVVALFFATFLPSWIILLIWNYSIVNIISICNPMGYWDAYWMMWFILLVTQRGDK